MNVESRTRLHLLLPAPLLHLEHSQPHVDDRNKGCVGRLATMDKLGSTRGPVGIVHLSMVIMGVKDVSFDGTSFHSSNRFK